MKKEWALVRWSEVDQDFVAVYAVARNGEGRKDWPWDLEKVFTLEEGLALLAQREVKETRFDYELRNINTKEVIHGAIIQA